VTNSVRDAKRNVKYRKICATSNNFMKVLAEGTLVLHVACHGEKNTPKNFPNYKREDGDFLIFEDEEGEAHYLSEKELRRLIERSKVELQCVIIASCYSGQTAKTFHNAGVNHVICIKEDEKIDDAAMIEFSKQFYYFLFTGKTVCEAFDLAKLSI